MATEKTTDTTPVNPIKDFNIITVSLTFEDYEPMQFKFRRALTQELKEQKQVFYGLNDAEQAQGRTAYRVGILSGVLLETPKNVPNYEDEGLDVDGAFRQYFSKPENTELLDWIYTIYQGKLYPKELM